MTGGGEVTRDGGGEGTRTNDIVSPRRAAALFVTLAICSAPAFFIPRVMSAMQGLYQEIDRANPYLSTLDPILLYFAMPLTVFGGIALVMSPGLLLSLAFDAARNPAIWFLNAFVVSLFAVSLATGLTRGLTGLYSHEAFLVATILAAVAAGIVLYLRLVRGHRLRWPDLRTGRFGYLLGLVVTPALILIVLTPKFFWEGFNGDGAHAYEASRLLLHQSLPFWPAEAGSVGGFPGFNSMLFAYPTGWFIQLFGPFEVSARLPFVLYLGLLHAAIVAVSSSGRASRMGWTAHALLSLSLVSYALIMSYSATYDPYCADIALPATQDTLLVIVFLGAVLAFLEASPVRLAFFGLLTLLTSPAGALLLGAWLVAVLVTFRPRPWPAMGTYVLSLSVAGAMMVILPRIVAFLSLPAPGTEHSSGALVDKLSHILISDYSRLAFLIVPCGIYPLVAIVYWRHADATARAFMVLALAMFFFYYSIAFVSLHYFVPVMVLPLVYFYREHGRLLQKLPYAFVAFFLVAISIALALPSSTAIYTASREIGEKLAIRLPGSYEAMEAGLFSSTDLLIDLFPLDSHEDVPEKHYGGSPLAWAYYSHRSDTGESERIYFLSDSEPSNEASLIAAGKTAAVFITDRARWEADRNARPAGSHGPEIYAMSRDILFRRAQAFEDYDMIYLGARLTRIREQFRGDG